MHPKVVRKILDFVGTKDHPQGRGSPIAARAGLEDTTYSLHRNRESQNLGVRHCDLMRVAGAKATVQFLALLLGSGILAGCPFAVEAQAAKAAAYLEEIRSETGTPGISAAVYHRGQLVFSEGVGYADLDQLTPTSSSTVYNIGSVSKAITAVAVLQQVERGRVELDDPIQKYVPSYPEKRWPVTIRHLLTHTSGIRHYRDSDFPDDPEFHQNCRSYSSLEQAIGIFKEDPLLFEPGQHYSYTSYGTNLLQGVVETASGLGFEDYLRKRIWVPAGMLRTALDIPDRIVRHRARGYLVENGSVRNHPWEDLTYKFAGGGMIGTAEDLVRFALALNAGQLLEKETLELMWRPHVDPVLIFNGDDEPILEDRWRLGLTWRLREDAQGRGYVYAAGTVKGFNAVLVNYRDDELVVALVGNGHPVTPALREAWALAELFFDQPPS